MGAATFATVTSINFYQPGQLNADLPFPTQWDELSTTELEAFARHQLSDHPDEHTGKAALLYELLQVRAKAEGVRLPEDFGRRLDVEDAVIHGLPLVEFLFEENNRVRQPYPTIKLPGLAPLTVHGPQDDFEGLTCGEFEDAEIFFYQFKAEPAAEPLAHLASVLWRPKGEPYMRYHSRKAKHRTYNAERLYPRFLKLQPWQLYSIFMWYVGCRNQLPKIFATVFEGGEKKDSDDFIAFTRCIHSGAGPKNGSRDQIRTTLLKEFFLDMELEAQKAKELKKAYERAK